MPYTHTTLATQMSHTPPVPFPPVEKCPREGCSCFRGLFRGSQGKLRESPGKIAGKKVPNRKMLQILGFWALEKANLPGTLGQHWRDLIPTFCAGSVFEIDMQFQPSQVFLILGSSRISIASLANSAWQKFRHDMFCLPGAPWTRELQHFVVTRIAA